MSESGFHRPRRAFAHDADSDEPTAADDTPADIEGFARRGVDPHSPGRDAAANQPVNDGVPDVSSGSANPFARPGSESASAAPAPSTEPLVPAPTPVLPGPDFDDVDPVGPGPRMASLADDPSPAPRRSAASSATPPEGEPLGATAQSGSGGSGSWVQHHKRTLLTWVIGALVAALLVVFGFYVAGQRGATPPPSSPSPSPSPSTSISAVPDVTGEDLLTVADADKIVGGASWAVISTALTAEEATERPACLSTQVSDVNAVDTFQRSLGTSQDDGLAALHQIDVYANEGAARQVQLERSQALAECDEVSALIEGSSVVTGLADEVTQLTVSRQDDTNLESPPSTHTVLLVRTGRALTMLDVTRSEAVPAIAAVTGLVRSLDSVCDRVDGMCPSDPAATAAVPPAVDPHGWLITADLPRLRPGYGTWKATDPTDVTSKGMGCENLPLATEPGPTGRQQRTYLMTQDDKTPKEFGIDEIVFDFADNPNARAFTTKLITNLLSCKERGSLTAKVADLGAVNGVGAEGVAVSARMITIDQAISDDSSVRFQLVVAIAGTRVSYMLATVAPTYEFSPSQLSALALRTAQRNSQG